MPGDEIARALLLLCAVGIGALAGKRLRIDIAGPSSRQHVAKSRAERAPAT